MQPVDEAVLRKEYSANKLTLTKNPLLVESMIKVARTLTDTAKMEEGLKKLSDAMLAKYKENIGKLDDPTISRQKVKAEMTKEGRAKDDKSRHLLSDVLAAKETEMGFEPLIAINGHPRIVNMTGLLSGKDFLNTVGAGHMAKDYVTILHGVYSHRIQWYCLAVSEKFGTELRDLFVQFQEGIAWLLTFDRRNEHPRAVNGDGTIDIKDFRTPEKLHEYLQMEDAAKVCPLLAAYIKNKVDALQGPSWLDVRKCVAARKLFPAKKAQLDGWKKMDTKALAQKLKTVLSAQEHKTLLDFLYSGKDGVDGHNVLYPKTDGTYSTTA